MVYTGALCRGPGAGDCITVVTVAPSFNVVFVCMEVCTALLPVVLARTELAACKTLAIKLQLVSGAICPQDCAKS